MISKSTFLILFLLFPFFSISQFSLFDDFEEVEKYDTSDQSVLYIPMAFNESRELDLDLEILNDRQVHHIDLVYTAYKQSETFDQIALNLSRIQRLQALIPQVMEDQPSFTFVEQTGARTADSAKNYFHGFAIHYGAKLDYLSMKEFHKEKQEPFEFNKVDNSKSTVLTTESGTILHIPHEAVAYEDGSPVIGEYELKYREFRSHADIILSGIPMTFDDGDTAKFLSSVGMFEIGGEKGGEKLILKKDITIDFICTAAEPNVSYFQLSADGVWDEKEKIDFDGENIEELGNNVDVRNLTISEEWQLARDNRINFDDYTAVARIDRGRYELGVDGNISSSTRAMDGMRHKSLCRIELSDLAYGKYIERREVDEEYYKDVVVKEFPESKVVMVTKDNVNNFIEAVAGYGTHEMGMQPESESLDFYFVAIPRSVLENLGMKPVRVKGLKAPKFTVYNCDKKERLEEPMAMKPKYFDRQTGKRISSAHMTYVVDMNLLTALSWSPKRVCYSSTANNKIVVFTEQKEIYLLGSAEFAQLSGKKRPSLRMLNITNEIGDSKSLQKALDS